LPNSLLPCDRRPPRAETYRRVRLTHSVAALDVRLRHANRTCAENGRSKPDRSVAITGRSLHRFATTRSIAPARCCRIHRGLVHRRA
jgi:hypothetical protein